MDARRRARENPDRLPMFPCTSLVGMLALCLAGPAAAQAPEVRAGPWSLLGPFDAPGGDVRVETGVEAQLKRLQAGAPWAALVEGFAGRAKTKLVWRTLGASELPAPLADDPLATGTLDLARLLGLQGPSADGTAAYLYRELVADAAGTLALTCGSDDGLRLWVNGELVVESTRPRGVNVHEDAFTLRLVPGTNHLLVKVANLGGGFGFALARARPVSSQDVNAAIDRGVEWLLAHQLYDGSWGSHQDAYPSGQTALTLYTLLKSGLSARHTAVLQALAYLEAHPAQRTYSIACQMFALGALHDPRHRGWMEEMTEQLLDEQKPDGGWSYPGDQSDLSNTQYAALALKAAAQAGIAVPTKAWLELVDYAVDHHEGSRVKEGGFIYVPGHDTGYTGSMTTAGITVLAVARAALGAGMPAQKKQAADAAIESGVAWLAKHWSVSQNPNKSDWHLYYLYGLERVGALLERARVGPFEWYPEGSRFLVRLQEASGAWNNSETDTCFALLFLARATSPASGDARDLRLFATAPEPICLRVRGGTPARLWIDPVAPERGKVEAVEFSVRRAGLEWERVGGPADGLATSHVFPEPGAYEVRAEALLAGGARLVSEVLALTHEEGLGAEQAAAAGDGPRNRLAYLRPRARASSAAEAAEHAVDGKSWTRWLCAADDADPWLEVELEKAQNAARLVLYHARTTRAENEGANPRPTRVELWLGNEKAPRLLELDPDPRARTVLELDPPLKLARFKLRIVAATDGELGAAALGFSEIELQEPDKKRGGKER